MQQNMQIWPSSARENQPCPDPAGQAEESSPVFPSGDQHWKQNNQHGVGPELCHFGCSFKR